MLNPFTPGATVSLDVTESTASVALSALLSNQVRVASPADNEVAFIRFGGSGITAALTDLPILPGTVEVFTVQDAWTHIAAIGTTGSTLYFTRGDGQ